MSDEHVDVKRARFERILASQGDGYLCSASQVSDYELCPRKWAFKYVEGVETPEKESTRFGTVVHGHLEDWFLYGVVPPDTKEGRCAHKMLVHLPHPSEVNRQNVEPEVDWMLGGVLFTMQLDLVFPEWRPPHLYDHKTTGDEMWAKSADPEHPNALFDDVQFTLYVAWLLRQTNAPSVWAQWTYGLRGKSKAWPVKLEVRGRDIQSRLSRTLQSAREMRMLKSSGLRALDIVYDAQGCEAFGGCPFQDRCNLTPQERMVSIMSDGAQRNLFLQQVAEKQGMAPPTPTNGVPAGAPPLVNPLLAAGAPAAPPGFAPPGATAPPELPKKRGRPATQGVALGAPALAPTPSPVASAAAFPPELVKGISDASAAQVFLAQGVPAARWAMFAAAAAQGVIQTLGMQALQNPGPAADLAATIADALQAEHAKRHPNT